MEQDNVCSITPSEFEKYCKEILLGFAEKEKLLNFKITHDEKIHADDGLYQIDLFASFTIMELEFKVICECKRYKNNVSREKVAVLNDKVRSLGAHKGILLSTSGFQSGAVQYAKKHGIALLRVYDRGVEYFSHSAGAVAYDEDDPFLYAERKLPPYCAIDCTAGGEEPMIIYPTRAIVEKIYSEMDKLIQEQYGLAFDQAEE